MLANNDIDGMIPLPRDAECSRQIVRCTGGDNAQSAVCALAQPARSPLHRSSRLRRLRSLRRILCAQPPQRLQLHRRLRSFDGRTFQDRPAQAALKYRASSVAFPHGLSLGYILIWRVSSCRSSTTVSLIRNEISTSLFSLWHISEGGSSWQQAHRVLSYFPTAPLIAPPVLAR